MHPGKGILIVGAGRVGRSLSKALSTEGVMTQIVPWRKGLSNPVRAKLVLIAVRDSELRKVSRALARHLPERAVCLHTSGLMPVAALSALRKKGHRTGRMHPLVSFVSVDTRLLGASALVEGDRTAVRAAETLAHALGMTPFSASKNRPALYHAAVALLANGSAALASVSSELLEKAGVEHGARHLAPLLRSVADNIETYGLPQALSGPVRRGDAEGVRRHLGTLTEPARGLYAALARVQLRMVRALGELSASEVRAMQALFQTSSAKRTMAARAPRNPR